MTQVFARDKKGDCGKWVDSTCLDNYVTDSKCENEKLVLIYSDGTEKATGYDCNHTEDTRLETNGQPVVNPDGSTTINFNVVNIETGEVIGTEQQVIPADDECVEYAAGTPLKDQANPVLHGCGDDGKGDIPLCDLSVEPTFITKCVASGGDGTPFDGIMVDATLTKGDDAKKIQFLPADDVTYPLKDAAWIDAFDAGSGIIDDAELVETGGLIRAGVKAACGWEWSIQNVGACCASSESWQDGALSGGASFCFPHTVNNEYYRWDQLNSEFGVPKITLTNTSNCFMHFEVLASSVLSRSTTADTQEAVPMTGLLFQTRLGEDGDALITQRDFTGTAPEANTSQEIWSYSRSVENNYSGRFNVGGAFIRPSGASAYDGDNTANTNRITVTLAAGETKTYTVYSHMYIERPYDPNDAPDVISERWHHGSFISARRAG